MAPPFTGAGKGGHMAINIREAKVSKVCKSCLVPKRNAEKLYEIGIGGKHKSITCLCDGCMHTLLQKLIVVGSEFNAVQ